MLTLLTHAVHFYLLYHTNEAKKITLQAGMMHKKRSKEGCQEILEREACYPAHLWCHQLGLQGIYSQLEDDDIFS